MEINQLALQLLKERNLKKTPARLFILNELLKSRFAISYSKLEKETKHLADRITLYRILKSFEQHGIIHKTIDHEGLTKYAICNNKCETNHHHDNHIHFNCTKCKQTSCLESVYIPKVTLPRGYKINEITYSVNGICKQCGK